VELPGPTSNWLQPCYRTISSLSRSFTTAKHRTWCRSGYK